MARRGTVTFKVGRSAKTGRFVSKKSAARHKTTTVVETITRPKTRPRPKKK